MDRSPERLLDAALPRWDVTGRHARTVPAPPDTVWQLDLCLTPVGRGTRLETGTRASATGPWAKRGFEAAGG